MSQKTIRLRFKRQTMPGEAPGTVKPNPDWPRPKVRVIAYGAEQFVEEDIDEFDILLGYVKRFPVTWIDIDALGDADTITRLGAIFDLHPLALEDVANVHQRAKVEPYGDVLFVIARIVQWAEHVETEQVSMFVGPNFVLTFGEKPGDCFDQLRDRLRRNSGRLRKLGPGYLAYTILDAVIDSYFPVVERLADQLDVLEDQVAEGHDPQVTHRLHQIRNDLLVLRRSMRPHRDAINELIRDEHPLIDAETRFFLRDCYDHTVQIIDLLEIYREMCGDLRDFHVTNVSHRLNETMKVLTIIATIFIPLSFIAGVYGMNFDRTHALNMPELGWEYGYLFSLGLMAATAGGLLWYFYRKGWIGQRGSPPEK